LKLLYVCTDNFTRSIIAEFCTRDYLKKVNIDGIEVASAGIRAYSDVSKYSDIHFNIMSDKNIDISGFRRTQFTKELFEVFDLIIGMSELHKDYVYQEYKREIPLFNELFNGSKKSVNVGAPNSQNFYNEMTELVDYIYDAVPPVLKNIEKRNQSQV
jgi:protein-tyrosine phosphatase